MKPPLIASLFVLITVLTPMLASAQNSRETDSHTLSISEILKLPSYRLSWEEKTRYLSGHPKMGHEAAEYILEYAINDSNYFFDSNARATLAKFAIESGATNLELLNSSYSTFCRNTAPRIITECIEAGAHPELAEAAFNYALTAYIAQGNALQILNKLAEHGFNIGVEPHRFLSCNGIHSLNYNRIVPLLLFILEYTKDQELATKVLKYASNISSSGEKESEQETLMEAALEHITEVGYFHFDILLNANSYKLPDETRIKSIIQLLEACTDPEAASYLLHKAVELSKTSYAHTTWLQVIQAALEAGADAHQSFPSEVSLTSFLKNKLHSNTLEPTLQTMSMLIERGVDLQEIDLKSMAEALFDHYIYHSYGAEKYPLSEESKWIIRTHVTTLLAQGHHCKKQYPEWGWEREMIENGLQYHMENPELILEKRLKHLGAPKSTEARIPPIMHHIWLTSPHAPREMRDEDTGQAIETKRIFDQGEETWEHIVWVNDPNLIPNSVQTLTDAGITIKAIDRHAEELSNYNYILQFIEEEKWGMASDTLRYSLIELFGGAYSDLNFIFERNLNDDIYRYDFFTENCNFNHLCVSHQFFAAKPQHPVVTRMTELVARNVGPNPPEYVKEAKALGPFQYTDATTAGPPTTAYMQKALEEDTIDVIYPKREASYGTEGTAGTSIDHYNQINTLKSKYPELAEACSILFNLRAFRAYPEENNLCPSEELYFGHDGTNGGTWLEFGNG